MTYGLKNGKIVPIPRDDNPTAQALYYKVEDVDKDIESFVDALASLLEDRMTKDGSFVHLLTCNADRRQAVGNSGCSCPIGGRIKSHLATIKLMQEASVTATGMYDSLMKKFRETEKALACKEKELATKVGLYLEIIEAKEEVINIQKRTIEENAKTMTKAEKTIAGVIESVKAEIKKYQ